MAQQTGVMKLYTDTLTHKRYVTDLVDFISPFDAPLWQYLEGANAASKFDIVNLPGHYVEWLEDSLRERVSGAAATLASESTSLQVTSGAGDYFRVGDILKIGSEYLYVSAVSTDTLTVARSFGATTASDISTGTTNIERLTIAQVDGMSYATSSQVDKSTGKNYVQIFEDTAQVSYMREEIDEWAVGSQLDYQVSKLIPQMMRHLSKALFVGSSATGSATSPPAMGGLQQKITDNTSSATTTALTQKLLEDAMYSAHADGGTPNLIVTNQWGLRKINSFYEGFVRTTRDENRGGIMIEHVLTPFGELDVLYDRWCDANYMFLLDTNFIGIYEFQPWTEEPVVQTAMAHARRVWGAYTLVLKHDKAHAYVLYSSSS